MSVRWRECVFPALVVVWVIAYWVQLDGAPPAARIVPQGVMLFIVALVVLIVARQAIRRGNYKPERSAAQVGIGSVVTAIVAYRRELGFLGLSVFYYLIFDWIGFHIANLVFLSLAISIAGNSWRTIVIGTVVTCAVIFGVAEVMQFNVPAPKLFR